MKGITSTEEILTGEGETELPDHEPEDGYFGCSDSRLRIEEVMLQERVEDELKHLIESGIAPDEQTRERIEEEQREELKDVQVFIMRNTGAVALKDDRNTQVWLEYFLIVLPYKDNKPKKIYLSGHTHCGMARTLLDYGDDPKKILLETPAIASLVKDLGELRTRVLERAKADGLDIETDRETILRRMEMALVHLGVENLLGYKVVKDAMANSKLEVYGQILDTEKKRIAYRKTAGEILGTEKANGGVTTRFR